MGSLKNLTFKGERGGFTKNQYRGGRLPKKGGGGLGLFVDLRRGDWQERGGGVVFEGRGVENLMHTMSLSQTSTFL